MKPHKFFYVVPIAAVVALASSTSHALAQANCYATNNPALRDSCMRQQMQIYQQESQTYGQIDNQLRRTQQFYQGVDMGMRAGTYGIQSYSGGQVPAYNAYNAGRYVGQSGYSLWDRR